MDRSAPVTLPSLLDKHQLLDVIRRASGVAVRMTSLRQWIRHHLLVPMERDGRRYLFHRTEVAHGVLIAFLQQLLGRKSALVFKVARAIRADLPPLLPWEGPDEAVNIEIKHAGGLVPVTIPSETFKRMREGLEEIQP